MGAGHVDVRQPGCGGERVQVHVGDRVVVDVQHLQAGRVPGEAEGWDGADVVVLDEEVGEGGGQEDVVQGVDSVEGDVQFLGGGGGGGYN